VDWLVAPGKPEYVPGGQALHAEVDLAPTSNDHVPALQFWYDDAPGTGQYAPTGQSWQSHFDQEPFLDK
jgi:hypothetical protein